MYYIIDKNIIIHICGASSSEKTTLGNRIKDYFGNNIIYIFIYL